MLGTQMFQNKNEVVNFISEYMLHNDDTLAIIQQDLRKELVKSLINKEDFNQMKDFSDDEEEVLFMIKTGSKQGRNLSLQICDAYSAKTNDFKMVDMDNILVIDGLISQEEMKSMIYYEELTRIKLQETA